MTGALKDNEFYSVAGLIDDISRAVSHARVGARCSRRGCLGNMEISGGALYDPERAIEEAALM